MRMKKHQDLMREHLASIQTQSTESKPVFWEIMFPADSGRQLRFSDDPDMKLDQLTQPKTAFQNFATAASDSQPTCASDPAGDLEPTDEDRAAWAASQAAAEEEWRMSQAGPVEGRMGYYGGPAPWEMLLPESNWESPRGNHPPIFPSSSGTSDTNVQPPPTHFR